MKVAFTGANGFVGTHLRNMFDEHVIIGRADTQEDILQKLDGVDVVINLAGAPIIKRWSDEYKKVLVDSRVQTTRKLVEAINKSDVKHFISTSAIGAYPDDGTYDETYTEYADDFLGSLTKVWEDEAKKANVPTSIVRFGIVLGADGGALKQMLLPFKMGVGGNIGDGQMYMSWVDVDDLVGAYKHIIDNSLEGTFNIVAPKPVKNEVFTKALGKTLNRPTIFPLPEFVLRLVYGEAATVLTGSKEIYPKALQESGYKFKYPDIEASLTNILK
jgi:uncharacterized protein (TIGR01777 family)